MGLTFKKATKTQARLRLALIGPSGTGKTYSSLAIGTGLGGRVAVIDTEHGSASKYASDFSFDVLELDSFGPETYVEAIRAAESAEYDVIIIDSLSHAWVGKDGALEQANNVTLRQRTPNSYTAWREVTPKHNALIDAIVGSKCHVIATMRSKTEYVQEKDDRGKTVIRKVGLAPVQRDGMDFEFDIAGDMDAENNLIISKSRLPKLSGKVINKPGAEFAATIKAWLTDGAPMTPGDIGNAARKVADAAQDWTMIRDVLKERLVSAASESEVDAIAADAKRSLDGAPKQIRAEVGEAFKATRAAFKSANGIAGTATPTTEVEAPAAE